MHSTFKNHLYNTVIESETKAGKRFDYFIQFLIIISIVVFSIETVELHKTTFELQFFSFFEIFIITIFTIEYGLRIWLTKVKKDYIFSFYGIVDFLAILPFYLMFFLPMMEFSLETLRALRLLRLIKVINFVRYTRTLHRLKTAFNIAKEELFVFAVLSLILLYIAAMGIYYFEHAAQPEKFRSIFDALWWAVATLTTVGYGDTYPITPGGRLFTFFILMIGLGIIAAPAGIIASALTQARNIQLNSPEPEINAQLHTDSVDDKTVPDKTEQNLSPPKE